MATTIADHRGQGTGVAVLKVRVNPNKCKTGVHPPWAGVPNGFNEWCLEGGNYRISGLYLKNGVIQGDINNPNLDIYVTGHCTFNGNITAGNLCIGSW